MDSGSFINFCFIIANFIWFYILNNKFSEKKTFYKGRYCWSIFFFLPFLILTSIYLVITWFLASSSGMAPEKLGLSYGAFGLVGIILIINTFNKLWKSLYNERDKTLKDNFKYLKLVVGTALAIQVMNAFFCFKAARYILDSVIESLGWFYYIIAIFIGDFSGNSLVGNSTLTGMVLIILGSQFILDLTIYNKAKKKIYQFSETPPQIPESFQLDTISDAPDQMISLSSSTIPGSTDYKNQKSENDSYQKLKDIKNLYDDGIISKDEFDAMKKEILEGWE